MQSLELSTMMSSTAELQISFFCHLFEHSYVAFMYTNAVINCNS